MHLLCPRPTFDPSRLWHESLMLYFALQRHGLLQHSFLGPLNQLLLRHRLLGFVVYCHLKSKLIASTNHYPHFKWGRLLLILQPSHLSSCDRVTCLNTTHRPTRNKEHTLMCLSNTLMLFTQKLTYHTDTLCSFVAHHNLVSVNVLLLLKDAENQ